MATHRYPIRKGKYEALSKKELARAIEIENEEVSTDEEYKKYEKRMKDDRKLNDFLGEDFKFVFLWEIPLFFTLIVIWLMLILIWLMLILIWHMLILICIMLIFRTSEGL